MFFKLRQVEKRRLINHFTRSGKTHNLWAGRGSWVGQSPAAQLQRAAEVWRRNQGQTEVVSELTWSCQLFSLSK